MPRRVQHEILLVPDEGADLAEVQPFQRRDAVVVVRNHRPRSIEEAHDRQYRTAGAEVRRCRLNSVGKKTALYSVLHGDACV